jgi:hypothetical protein
MIMWDGMDGLPDWELDWVIDWFSDSFIGWLIVCRLMDYWLIDWLTD